MSAAPQLALVASVPTDPQWLTADQVMAATGWKRSSFFTHCGELISRESATKAANGRPVREYLASSLPAAAQPHQLAVVAPPASMLGPLFAGVPAATDRIALPDPDDEKQAEERYQILRPVLDYAEHRERYAQLLLADGRPVTSQERMIEYAAAGCGRTPRALKRWLATYRQGGFAALADRIRSDKGQSRWFAAHPKAAWVAAYYRLGDSTFDNGFRAQPITVIRERLIENRELFDIAPGDEPSYETIRTWLGQTPAALAVYAHKGRKAYNDEIAAYMQYAYTDIYANAWWVTDHALLDVESQNDIFVDLPEGAPYRIRITSFIDFRSRKVMGVSFCPEGSSRSLAAALYRAVERYGLPKGIKADNGKDLQKIGRGAMTSIAAAETAEPAGWWQSELDQITAGFLARLGIAVSYAIPFHPQAKNIERWHRTLHEHFCAAWPTYTSGSPATRPDATEAAMYRHRKLLRHGRANESFHPLASQVVAMALAWIEEYNGRPHSGRGMDGQSPNEVFAANLDPNPRPAPTSAELALLLADHCTRQVIHGAITLDRHRYVPAVDDDEAARVMHWSASSQVIVAYDRCTPETVAVLDQDGRYLCTLIAETYMRFAPGDPEVQQQIAASMRSRRGLERDTRDQLALVARTARQIGALSPIEDMASRLRLPAGETGAHAITQRNINHKPALDKPTQPMTPAQVARLIAKEQA